MWVRLSHFSVFVCCHESAEEQSVVTIQKGYAAEGWRLLIRPQTRQSSAWCCPAWSAARSCICLGRPGRSRSEEGRSGCSWNHHAPEPALRSGPEGRGAEEAWGDTTDKIVGADSSRAAMTNCPHLQLILHTLVLLGLRQAILLIAMVVDAFGVQLGAVCAGVLLTVAVVIHVVVHGRGGRWWRGRHHHVQLLFSLDQIVLGLPGLGQTEKTMCVNVDFWLSPYCTCCSPWVRSSHPQLPCAGFLLFASPGVLQHGDFGRVLCQFWSLTQNNNYFIHVHFTQKY